MTIRPKRPDSVPRESCRERFGKAAMTDTCSPLGGITATDRIFTLAQERGRPYPVAYEEMCKTGLNPLIGLE